MTPISGRHQAPWAARWRRVRDGGRQRVRDRLNGLLTAHDPSLAEVLVYVPVALVAVLVVYGLLVLVLAVFG